MNVCVFITHIWQIICLFNRLSLFKFKFIFYGALMALLMSIKTVNGLISRTLKIDLIKL